VRRAGAGPSEEGPRKRAGSLKKTLVLHANRAPYIHNSYAIDNIIHQKLKHEYIQTDIQIKSLKDVSALIKTNPHETNPHAGIKFSSLNLSRHIHSYRMASGDLSTNAKLLSSHLEAALQMKG
jgi:hypothetical protein